MVEQKVQKINQNNRHKIHRKMNQIIKKKKIKNPHSELLNMTKGRVIVAVMKKKMIHLSSLPKKIHKNSKN